MTTRSIFESRFHVHDDDCLEEVAGGTRWTATGDIEVPEPGWVRCTLNPPVRLHRHADRLMAHQSGDRMACRTAVPA